MTNTTFSTLAALRVTEYLKNYDTDHPAELLADILHYCAHHNIDFTAEIERAEGYVAEELGVDGGLD